MYERAKLDANTHVWGKQKSYYNISNIHRIGHRLVTLKHTTTLFSLSDHYIREWIVIVDQVQTNRHGRLMVL